MHILAEMKLIECPRDAMQGIEEFIPTKVKIEYINSLLEVGFDTIDFGSFVSPKAIPQMRDTAEVLKGLNIDGSKTHLLAIVANLRGAHDAVSHEPIKYLGYPFSVSETFQKRNTNASIDESLKRVEEIQKLAKENNRILVVYLSMAFGNPYGDHWHPDIVAEWTYRLANELEIEVISLADTIGVSNPENISGLFNTVIPEFEQLEIGAHLHTTPDTWKEKVSAVVASGCERIDGAIKGFGGCPMADDELTGNMATENIISFLKEENRETGLNEDKFNEALMKSNEVFLVSH
ncbi:MAG: hydroxymethylglutaryl-CoA lyase [Flavobacteriales bacterium]|nr:hydroxymethylglutaryl-CoA lyase [Flavobacteriales bacterium]